MSLRRVKVLTILLLFFANSQEAIKKDDPCSTIKRLNDWRRSISFSTRKHELCDSNLGIGWYRITSCAGNKMQTSCPVDSYTCGTDAPMWLSSDNTTYERLYPVNGETVSRLVCAAWEGNCCRWSATIKIKDCNGYYVYYLTRSPQCLLAYCFGDKIPYDLSVRYNASTEDPDGCSGFYGGNIFYWIGPTSLCDLDSSSPLLDQ